MRPTTVKPTPLWRPSAPMRMGESSSRRSACLPMSSILAPSRTRVDLQNAHTATIELAPRKRSGPPHDGQLAVFTGHPSLFRRSIGHEVGGACVWSTSCLKLGPMPRTHASPPGHWNWRIPVTHRHGTRHGRLMFVGGQSDLDAKGEVLNAGDLLAQADACMAHIARVVETLGGRARDIVKLNAFYVGRDLDDEVALLRRLRARVRSEVAPVVSLVRLPRLSYPGMMLVVDAVAIDDSDGGAPRVAANPEGHWPWPEGAQFSHGLRCGELLFVSAQMARDASGAIAHRQDIVGQAELTIANIGRVLASMGADLDDVVKLNTWFVGFGTDEDWRRAARVRSEAVT